MNRGSRKQQAEQTVLICREGRYEAPSGAAVQLGERIQRCLEETRYFTPEDLERLRLQVLGRPRRFATTRIEVHQEPTLAGVRRLLTERPNEPVAALNFASAKNPGGGFLNGSEAQEESLARSTALYPSLLRGREYYERHRQGKSCLYSDAMILSPCCPVFRGEDGTLLEEPYAATFVTSCAPNAGALSPAERLQLPEVLRRRAELVLSLTAAHEYAALVLGAWGCGVFRNDPRMVARIFADLLRGAWLGRLERVVFAIVDRTEDQGNLASFRAAFSAET